MDDLISRQAALDCFHDWIDRRGDVHTADEMQEYNAIEALPSAQPERIYCKDCKHWEQESICDGYCSEIEKGGFDEDHFCSYAERREDA